MADALGDLLGAAAARSGQERREVDADDLALDTTGVTLALNYADEGRLLGISERAVRRLVPVGQAGVPHFAAVHRRA